MYAIAYQDADGVIQYWIGGKLWSEYPFDAAQFTDAVDARATYELLVNVGAFPRRSYFAADLRNEIASALDV